MIFRKKHKYRAKTKNELRKLILNEEIQLNEIDTSCITDMSHLFEPVLETGAQARFFFNGIETWDVSNVRDMSYMFCFARNFNEDLSAWNVSKVESMRGMFQFASSFNKDISLWNVSSVRNMSSMFYDAAAFSQNLDKWDIKNVRTMRFMFMYARYFNHEPKWDLKDVEDIVGMYYGTPIVYVDPDVACGVDPEIERLAAQEGLKTQLELSSYNDGIANYAKDMISKINKYTDKLDTSVAQESELEDDTDEKSVDEKIKSSDDDLCLADDPAAVEREAHLQKLQYLLSQGLISTEEFNLLKDNLKNKIC